jgi:HK97 family phage prohead protease
MTQHLFGSFEIKAKDEGARTFEGALSTSHLDLGSSVMGFRDIVHPGAFKRTLEHFKSAKDPYIPLLDSHSRESVMNVFGHLVDGEERLTGAALKYARDDGGMHEVPEMVLNTKWQVIDGIDGERLLDRMRPGSVRKMSMGYEPKRSDYVHLKEYGRARNLREVAITEGSLVVFPMNTAANVNTASVKSLFDALRAGTLSDEDSAALLALPDEAKAALRALLDAAPAPVDEPPAGTPKGLAPDAPDRIALSAMLRDLRRRALTAA